MPSLDSEKREALVKAINVSIETNSMTCASCLDISLSEDADEALCEAFQNLAELCATNVKLFRLSEKALKEAWGIIDFRRDVDSL